MAGILYVVGMPIGNIEDLSFRALRVLREVQAIAAEDPQITQPLLKHYDIDTPLTTYHWRNQDEKIPILIQTLQDGGSIALVSDAGTPAICDPGSSLINRALESGMKVVSIPGPSAAVAAVSASGFPGEAFVVYGCFLDRSDRLRETLKNLRSERRLAVLFIQPVRLRSLLQALRGVVGTRRIALAKNLSMPDEELLRGTAGELLRKTARRPVRGECTLVIQGLTRRRNPKRKAP
jgi:16S rRNA (cytidine1402-2'-O)-methyltransferase